MIQIQIVSTQTKLMNKIQIASTQTKLTFKIEISILEKILINYLQSLSILKALRLKLPEFINDFLGIFSSIGNASESMISLECFAKQNKIGLSSFYVKTIFNLIIPFVAFLIIILGIIIKKKSFSKNEFLISFIVVCVFFQPSIIYNLFDYFSCKTIDKDSYLNKSIQIKCNSDNFQNWVFFICLKLSKNILFRF